jgi:hypothetical protein
LHREEATGDFEDQAGKVAMKPDEFKKNPSFFRELVMFIKHNKKWYLIPVIISILLVGILIALGSTGAAPFIYTLF